MINLTEEQKEANRLWLEGLRSGRYEQGRDFLCADNQYCCLGVDCALAGLRSRPYATGASMLEYCFPSDGLVATWDRDEPEYNWFLDRHGFSVHDVSGIQYADKEYADVIRANDSGVPFTVIAQAIETYLKADTDQYE